MAGNKHGGRRPGAGRKPKTEEERTHKLALSGLKRVYGSETKFFEDMAKKAMGGSFNHARLLAEYIFGKPKEKIEVDNQGEFVPFQIIMPKKGDK